MNLVPIRLIEQIQKIQKKFIWNVDIEAKIRSLQLGWVWQFFVEDYHPWKIIPLNVLKKFAEKKYLSS